MSIETKSGRKAPLRWCQGRKPQDMRDAKLLPYAVKHLSNMLVTDLIKRMIRAGLPPLAGPVNTYHDVSLLHYTLSRWLIESIRPSTIVWNSRPKNFTAGRHSPISPGDTPVKHRWVDPQLLPALNGYTPRPAVSSVRYTPQAEYWGYVQGAPNSSAYEIDPNSTSMPISSDHFRAFFESHPAQATCYAQMLIPQLSFSIKHQIGVPELPDPAHTYFEHRGYLGPGRIPAEYSPVKGLNNVNNRETPDKLSPSWLRESRSADIQDLRFFYEPVREVLRQHYSWLPALINGRLLEVAYDLINHTRMSGPRAVEEMLVAKVMEPLLPHQNMVRARGGMLDRGGIT